MDLYKRAYAFKLIFNFSEEKHLKQHFLKLSAFLVLSLEDLRKEASFRIKNPKDAPLEQLLKKSICREEVSWEQMPHNRYYIDHPLNLFDDVSFDEAEFNHMVKVMRVSLNEEIEIINGDGVLAKAIIRSIEKKSVHATIQEIKKESKPKKRLYYCSSSFKRRIS